MQPRETEKEVSLKSTPADGIVAARSANEKLGNPRIRAASEIYLFSLQIARVEISGCPLRSQSENSHSEHFSTAVPKNVLQNSR